MNEIKCPHCGKAFTVDEAGYAAILSQVRTKEFDNEVHKRLEDVMESARKEGELNLNKALAEKDSEINGLKLQLQQLESDAKNSQSLTELEISKAVDKEKKAFNEIISANNAELSKRNEEVMRLNAELEKAQLKSQLELHEAVSQVEKERDTQKAEYEAKLKAQQETLDYYKELKIKMSTKMIGETLEQHCENAFNMIRATAFRNAEFGKDNDVREGSKGDYIYREKDVDGNELISIMFEMKNEMDTTATKHKNEDFFAKLDKDRKNKKCEYAVLVSLLESESELYNQGIVDVSYDYEKMYVIRPQFFIPMITILRNAAMNSMEYKRQLAEIKNQEIDITRFEERIEDFKTAFSKNYTLAGKQFNNAIEEIDKTIDHLNKVKENLQKSLNNLRLANDKAQNQLTIKSLAKDNSTMLNMFNELEEK
ncbi:MAG: DUF2130 domain-containing protein [Ruminococcus sp.]|nr:DUF2130 domain-containing protein [Ruminococcus sp.]